jgi:hypothetical protein
MWRELLGIATAAMLLATTAAAKADNSANFYLPACRNFINKVTKKDPIMQGQCVGILEGITFFAANAPFEEIRFCIPPSVTSLQSVTVVVKWLEQHPGRWKEDFRMLASYALHDTWPCRPR